MFVFYLYCVGSFVTDMSLTRGSAGSRGWSLIFYIDFFVFDALFLKFSNKVPRIIFSLRLMSDYAFLIYTGLHVDSYIDNT